jgi:hypothetical protein
MSGKCINKGAGSSFPLVIVLGNRMRGVRPEVAEARPAKQLAIMFFINIYTLTHT